MLALLALFSAPAFAEDGDAAAAEDKPKVSVSFNLDTEIRLQRYNPAPLVHIDGARPRFIEEVTRLVGRASRGRWTFGIQVDQLAFIGLPHLVDGEEKVWTPAMQNACPQAPSTCLTNPFREMTNDRLYMNPEKVSATYKGKDFDLTFGDFYASFGVGAVMNINRNVDNDVDTSIQGVKMVAQPGEWKFTALGGMLNRQQVFQDQPNFRLLDGDRRHLVAGVRAERYNIGATTVGAHGVMYNYVTSYGDPDDVLEKGLQGPIDAIGEVPDALIGGATMATSLGGLDLNLEADLFAYNERDLHPNIFVDGREEVKPGTALYGSGLWFVGSTTWQLEVRRFKNVYRLNNPIPVQYGYTVVAPPTLELERAINIDTAAVTGSNDLSGGLLRVDGMVGNATPYVAFGIARDQDLVNAAQKAPAPETSFQLQAGAEIIADHWSLLVQTLARMDVRDEGYDPDRQLYGAADLKAPLPIGAGTQISLVGQLFDPGPQAFGDATIEPDTWHEFNSSVTVLATPDLGITGFYDHTTNPVANNGGNLKEDWPAAYGAVELFWKPTSSWTVKAFHGGYAAGIRCSGGQCRNVPAFTGTRLAVVGTFQ